MRITISKAKKKKLIRRLIIALVCILAVVFGLIGYLYFRTKANPYDLTEPYSPSADLFDGSDSQTGSDDEASCAEPFAADLVVSDSDVDLGNIQLQSSDERGLLFNISTKEAKFSRGCYDRVYPASITKIMTAILCVKYGDLDQSVTMTDTDVNLGEDSQVSGMAAGDVVTLRQLFSALLVYSANDAAMAIARTVGGSVSEFVNMMNEEAASLGMTGTHFSNPHGLHDENHYTTSYDVYLMLNEASKYTQITDVMKNSIYKLVVTDANGTSKTFNLDATDKYLSGAHALPDGVTIMAGKTGTTDAAGNCLALAVQNKYGIPYICIIMNAPNKKILYADMDTLLEQTNAE